MFRGYFGTFFDSMMGAGRGRQSTIEKLLEADGQSTPLEQILADSEVLTECKWGNQKLMNYFDHDKVCQLVKMITEMPPEGASHDRGHKYPFVVSEIFNCELNKINDLFFKSRAEEEENRGPGASNVRKEISSSPLPKDNEEEEEQDSSESSSSEEEDEGAVIVQKVEIKSEESATEEMGEPSQGLPEQERENKAEKVKDANEEQNQENETVSKAVGTVSDDEVAVESLDQEDDEDGVSTAPTTQAAETQAIIKNNKYELFELLLSFIDTEEELNPVLCGYFCKTFAQLISNKTKEVYSYVYSHPQVLDNLIRHSYQKSLSEVLIKLLNTSSENVFFADQPDLNPQDIASIRASFVFKIVQKLSSEFTYEDNLNAAQILTELADQKPLLAEMVSQRCLEEYIRNLASDSGTSKQNTYMILSTIIAKSFQKEEDIVGGLFNQDKKRFSEDDNEAAEEDKKVLSPIDSERLFGFISTIIREFVSEELKVNPEDLEAEGGANPHERQYGSCRKPFGLLRMRVIEFVAEVFKHLYRPDLHYILLNSGLYTSLLHFFDHYPFHNILHQKISEILLNLLDKSSQDDDEDHYILLSVLEETPLLRKILDAAASRDLSHYTFPSTGLSLSRGHMPFIRKLANKLASLQSKNEHVANMLDSIPEWADFKDNELKRHNELESRQLGQEERNGGGKGDSEEGGEERSDQYMDFMAKLQGFGKGGRTKKVSTGFSLLTQGGNDQDEDEEEDDDEDELEQTSKGPMHDLTGGLGFGMGIEDDGHEEQTDQQVESQEVFDRIMLQCTIGDNELPQSPPGSEKYQSQSREKDLLAREEEPADTPHFGQESSLSPQVEVPEYQAQFFWKVENPTDSLDELLKDYDL